MTYFYSAATLECHTMYTRHNIPTCHCHRNGADLTLCLSIMRNAKLDATTTNFKMAGLTYLKITHNIPPTVPHEWLKSKRASDTNAEPAIPDTQTLLTRMGLICCVVGTAPSSVCSFFEVVCGGGVCVTSTSASLVA